MKLRLIITGYARSGTSFLARFITKMGYPTGGVWDDKIDGGMEDAQVGLINGNLQRTFTNNRVLPEDKKQLICSQIRVIDRVVIKHPRFITHPDIIKVWHEANPAIKLLVTTRNPEDCIKSVRRVKNKNVWTVAELTKQHKEFLEAVKELKIEHRIIHFPYFLHSYESVYQCFSDLGIKFDKNKGEKMWNKMVDFKKVHFK